MATPLVEDVLLAGLDACTKTLKEPGDLGIALVFKKDRPSPSVHVTQSTVDECRVVECVKERLAQLRTSSVAPTTASATQHVELALAPREPVKRVKGVAWPPEKSQSCTDDADELGELRTGRLPPEQIQAVIRAKYPEFRKCYESGLASNGQLSGRVGIRFVIERDGHVSNSYIQDNDIPDCRVAQCVRDQMTKIVFPKPEKGLVKVLYPIQFSPG